MTNNLRIPATKLPHVSLFRRIGATPAVLYFAFRQCLFNQQQAAEKDPAEWFYQSSK
jgi:hypothetical protein